MDVRQQLFETPTPVALVTGAGAPRVGNRIARRLAGLGFTLAVHYNESEDSANQTASEIRDRGGSAFTVSGPVEKQESVQEIFQQIQERCGRIDVVINSAAIWYPIGLEDTSAEDVRRFFDVNTLGSFLVAQAAGRMMVDQATGGVIVNLGEWATERPYVDHVAYLISKSTIPTMTRALALELGERNRRVRVNAVLPGPVLLSETISDEMRRANEESTLLKRVGTPDHVASAVEFLISNDFVTGVCLPVDGGRSIYAGDQMQIQHRCN